MGVHEFALFGVFISSLFGIGLISFLGGWFVSNTDDESRLLFSWLTAVVIAALLVVIQYGQALPA